NVRPNSNRRVKSKAGVRRVPIHSAVAPALLHYVATRKKAGEHDLFDTDAHAFSMKWSRWTLKLDIEDRAKKSAHSFRHAFKDRLRDIECPAQIQDALLGHATRGEGARYGSGYSARVLASWMEKLSFPVTLS